VLRLKAAAKAMTIRITQIDNEKRDLTILRVEGKLHLADAEIVERMFDDSRRQNGRKIEVDLTAISFIDGASAAVLRRIEAGGASLTGLDFFIRQLIETPE
jgi:anti-anti-sigma regulatory factor